MIGIVGTPFLSGPRVRRACNLILVTLLLVRAASAPVRGADVVPVNVRTAPGQFDIAAQDASVAHAVSAIADETWRGLAGLLDGNLDTEAALTLAALTGTEGSPA